MTLEKPHLVPIFACLVTTKMQIWASPLPGVGGCPSCGWSTTGAAGVMIGPFKGTLLCVHVPVYSM